MQRKKKTQSFQDKLMAIASSNDVDPRDALALQQAKNEAAKLDVEKLKLLIQLAEIQGKQGN